MSTNSTTWAIPGIVDDTPARQPMQARISASAPPEIPATDSPSPPYPAPHVLLSVPMKTPRLPRWFAVCSGLLALHLAPARLAAQVDYLPPGDAAIVAELMPEAKLLEGGVRFLVKEEGKGPLIRAGDTVTALYIGRLLDGTIFNQKRSRFHSYRFLVGANPRQIIRGWEVALPHMRDGGTYLVAIPSVLGYRKRGRPGQVPPHTTITFKIEIIGVERGPDSAPASAGD